MRMKRMAVLSLAAALSFGLMAPALSQARDGAPRGGWMESLTPEQQQTAKKIFADTAADRKALRKALEAKRAEIDAVLASENPDKTKIEALSREMGEIQGRILLERLDTREKLVQAGIPAPRIKANRKLAREEKPRKGPARAGNAGAEKTPEGAGAN